MKLLYRAVLFGRLLVALGWHRSSTLLGAADGTVVGRRHRVARGDRGAEVMRATVTLLALAVGVATAGSAVATVLPFEATLRFSIARVDPVTIVDGGVATLNGSGGGLHLTYLAFAAGAFRGSAIEPVTDPAVFPISGLLLDASNGAGAIGETGGGTLRGAIGLPGVVKICLFGAGGCAAPTSNISVPLTPVGQGGTSTGAGPIGLTVYGAPWTTATASVGTATEMGWARGPLSGPSSTAQVGGSVRLVTPIYISTNVGASASLPSFAVLTLRFVPEPSTALLLGVGFALLGRSVFRR